MIFPAIPVFGEPDLLSAILKINLILIPFLSHIGRERILIIEPVNIVLELFQGELHAL